MTFLSLIFLAASPLIAAPLLLHWFDRRRSVVIEWGAMQFLSEATTRKSSARRFQHWFLLLLRIVAIAALVLALARPLIPASWLGTSGRHEVVMILDNSLSTQQRSNAEVEIPATSVVQEQDAAANGKSPPELEDPTVFNELIGKMSEVVVDLQPGSAVRILTTSPYPAWVTTAPIPINQGTRQQLLQQLSELRANQGSSDLPAALFKAIQSELDEDRLAGRRIVLFTDGQRQDWRTQDTASWERFRSALQEVRVATSLEVVEATTRPARNNVAISSLAARRAVVGVMAPVSIAADCLNYSAKESPARSLEWRVNGEKLSETVLPVLEPGAKHQAVLQHAFPKPGVYAVSCRLTGEDDLSEDDSNVTIIEVLERIPIVVVEDSEALAEIQQDSYLVRAALGHSEGAVGDDDSWRAVYEPRSIPSHRLDDFELNDYHAVVVPNVTQLSEQAIGRLRQFVEDGGGLWLALGPRTDLESFNRGLFQDGGGLSPARLARLVDESPERLQQPTINPFIKNHPATTSLADDERLDTGEVKITRRFRFDSSDAEGQLSVLLDLSNGEPLAVEHQVGRGRVIVQAIPLKMQWSDLAVSQAFVVMVQDWLNYLTEPKATKHNLKPGEPIAISSTLPPDTPATLTSPDGIDSVVVGEPSGPTAVFRTSRTALPGTYHLAVGIHSSVPFQVSRDGGESELAGLTTADRQYLTEMTKPVVDGPMSEKSLAGVRTPIWHALLILLIVVMAGELVLSGVIARKRFGAAPISETSEQHAPRSSIATGMSLGKASSRRVGQVAQPNKERAGA